MHVLFLPAPAIGHAFPLVPLAWAFRHAGHDATFVTAGDGLAVANAGMSVLDALPGVTSRDMLATFVKTAPELFEPVTGDLIAEFHRRKPYTVAVWDPYVDAHLAVAEQVRPDLVVYDPVFGVGPVVAAKLGIPAVAHGISLTRFSPELLRDLPGARSLRRLDLQLPEGIPTIDVVPPSLGEGPPSEILMRYIPYNGNGLIPTWLTEPADRARIAATLGSLMPRDHVVRYVDQLVSAVNGLDVEIVVALGRDNADAVPEHPSSNVRAVGWVPMNELLRTCVGAIHHGGDGTTMTCCAFGVPQLVIPDSPDLVVTAELLRDRGAAHVMPPAELDQAAIDAFLGDEKLRRVAVELQAEIGALPGPAEIVDGLVARF